ncbi:MFS transporter [Salimicrobium flavidum]|uniref:Predicted arabinose efflux permease, MFS family n=1 Tax=Salimicrobium flavidum TaxID=570947 RepID=A0A1N7IZS8_9BACI|nr:MFS transporter [Salimicrobium flavidum]SIS42642.1 Predicted arabinose efflux permease, MFS family [Salimicrobium flavidum]
MKGNALTGVQHLMFLAAIFCFWFATYIYVPTFSVYLERIDLVYSQIGVILGAYGITQIALRWPLGVFLEWLSGRKKKWLMFGFLFATLSGSILALFETFTLVLVGRLLAGVTASMWVMATIMYGQYFPLHKSTQAMSTMQFMTVFTQFVSMVLCSLLISWFGWDFPFWTAAAFSVVGAVLLLFIPEVVSGKEEERTSFLRIFKQTMRMKEVWGIASLSLIGHAVLFVTIFGFSPLYLVELGYSEEMITWLVFAFFIPHMFTSLGLAYAPVKEEHHFRILWGSFIGASIFLLFVPTSSLVLFLLMHAGAGFTLGMVLPMLLGRAASLGNSGNGMAVMGMFQSLYAIGIFIGPYISGELANVWNLDATFYFASFLALTGALITFIMKKPLER